MRDVLGCVRSLNSHNISTVSKMMPDTLSLHVVLTSIAHVYLKKKVLKPPTRIYSGTLALDNECDLLLCNSKIPSQLVEMLRTKRRDAGLLTQILHTVYRLLRLPRTRSALLYSSNVMDAVCECLKSSNDTVVSTADLVINLASDHDRLRAHGTLWEQFRIQRFETHNREWVDMITEVDMDEGFVEEGKLYFDDEGSSVLGQSRDDSELDRLGGTAMTNEVSLGASWRSDDGTDSPRSRPRSVGK